METYTRNEFRALFWTAIEQTHAVAQREVAELLPEANLLVLGAFAHSQRASSVDEILVWLYRDGTFPRVVVVGVNGIVDGKALVGVLPSGHAYVRDRALTWLSPAAISRAVAGPRSPRSPAGGRRPDVRRDTLSQLFRPRVPGSFSRRRPINRSGAVDDAHHC